MRDLSILAREQEQILIPAFQLIVRIPFLFSLPTKIFYFFFHARAVERILLSARASGYLLTFLLCCVGLLKHSQRNSYCS